MSLKNNRFITIMNITLINTGCMKIGNGDDGILIDLASNSPYIPGTSIAGAMRAYAKANFSKNIVEDLFGHGDKNSNIYISDSYASNKKEIEYRPGIRINNRLGINEKGGYFERELLGSGHKFFLEIKIYSKCEEQKNEQIRIVKSIFNAIESAELRFGANKTNGSGILHIDSLKICELDLENSKDFIQYVSSNLEFKDCISILSEESSEKTVKFTFEGVTDTPLLVAGYDSLNYQQPDGSNMMNSNGKYILPGSSFKGAIRNNFTKISKLKGLNYIAEIAFGQEASSSDKKVGRLYFEDIEIENALDSAIYNRIKIDQFTGGVRVGAILNQRPIKGSFKSEVYYKLTGNEDDDKKIIATMLYTLRDALSGDISFGSGHSIGRGKLKGNFIKLEMNNETAKLDLKGKNHENKELILNLISVIN